MHEANGDRYCQTRTLQTHEEGRKGDRNGWTYILVSGPSSLTKKRQQIRHGCKFQGLQLGKCVSYV